MVAKNPGPSVIGSYVWDLWTGFAAHEPHAVLSGIFADKPGYHNARANLPSDDYSVHDVAADRYGPSAMASAIDISLPAAQMQLYTKRLDAAARARDPRLFPAGKAPVLREFIGTKDSKTVYCYMLTGGIAQGVGADAGPDWGRDDSHLWHLHMSIIRQHINDASAMAGLLAVLKGEKLVTQPAKTTPPAATKPGDIPPLPADSKVPQWGDTILFVDRPDVAYSKKWTTLKGILPSISYYVLQTRNLVQAVIKDGVPLSEATVDKIATAVAAKINAGPATPPIVEPPK